MSIYIKVNNIEYPATIKGGLRDRDWDYRDTKTIHLTITTTEIAALLPSGTPWSIVQRDTVPTYDDETGEQTGTQEVVQEWDNSEYSISGAITDHRDGTVSIKMGKPTDAEASAATVVALAGTPVTMKRAMVLRVNIEQAASQLSDSDAAECPELSMAWRANESVVIGDRRSNPDAEGVLRLYKCVQAHTTQAGWEPHLTPAMWVVIDVAHAGTQDDPIPASRGMEYEYGLYYLDGEDGKTYLCERTGEAAGGKIVLQYLPHELVGNYFTIISA